MVFLIYYGYMVFLKVLSLVLFFSFFTQLHLATLFLGHHKLYADDTRLFLSFSPCNFPQNIQLLQNTISDISSWMASNFLSLNSSKLSLSLSYARSILYAKHLYPNPYFITL